MKKNQRQDLNDDKAAGTPGVVLGTKSKRLCTSLVVTLAIARETADRTMPRASVNDCVQQKTILCIFSYITCIYDNILKI